jgi:sortase A
MKAALTARRGPDSPYLRRIVFLTDGEIDEIASGKVVKPWPWADTWPVARIAVPRLSVQAVVLAESSGQALAFAGGLC